MRELAAKAGVSQPFLSKVENGLSTPSISTLYKVAHALGVPAQDLLPRATMPTDVDRAGGGSTTRSVEDDAGALSTLLTGGPGRLVEARSLTLQSSRTDGEWFEHEGEDFLYVVSGLMDVEFGDGRIERLGPDESLWFRSTVPHRWRNAGDKPTQLLLINARLPFVPSDLVASPRGIRPRPRTPKA
jgi:transcriptional regulator with XRE-family HTH domain